MASEFTAIAVNGDSPACPATRCVIGCARDNTLALNRNGSIGIHRVEHGQYLAFKLTFGSPGARFYRGRVRTIAGCVRIAATGKGWDAKKKSETEYVSA